MTDKPRHELVALAWELREQGHALRYIAERVGRSLSVTHAMVAEGRAEATWIEIVDRSEEGTRARLRLDMMTSWLLAEREATGASAMDVVPIMLKLEERRAKSTGSDAPPRSVLELMQLTPPTVDADMAARLVAVEERSARALDDLRAELSEEGPT